LRGWFSFTFLWLGALRKAVILAKAGIHKLHIPVIMDPGIPCRDDKDLLLGRQRVVNWAARPVAVLAKSSIRN